MHWIHRLRTRARAFFRLEAVDRDLRDEVEAHLAAVSAEYEAAGQSPAAARSAALRDFGGVAQVMETCREVQRMPWLADSTSDAAFAWRLLRRSPGFAIAAIVTLALGLGANTAIYSVIRGVLLRPAPLPMLERLVMLWETDRTSGTTREPASVPDFLDYRSRGRTVDALAAFSAGEVNLTHTTADPERLATLQVTAGMLNLLGVAPVAGRGFSADEDRTGGPAVVLVSHSLARRLFGRPEAALGQSIDLDERPQSIIGIVPDQTDFGVLQILSAAAYSRAFADRGEGAHVDVWMPLRPDPATLPRSTHPIFMIGRVATGSSRDAVHAEFTTIAADLEKDFPENRGRGANAEMLTAVIFGPVRPILYVLGAAVFLVLLIACVNVMNLQLARGASRTQEVAVRSAVGAGPARLLRQFFTESVLLTCLAAGAGLVVAHFSMRALLALAPADVPRLSLVSLDGGVFGAALIVASMVAISIGIVPAIQARRVNLANALKSDGAGRGTADRDRTRVRSVLVVAELAAAVMLLSGAGLLIRSFWNLQHVAPGFDPSGVLKAEFQLPITRYPAPRQEWPHLPRHHAFSRELLTRAAALPGVTNVALAANHPLDPGFTNSWRIVGREAEGVNWPEISVRTISPGYLQTVRLPLKRGRDFTDADHADAPRVVLINEATADRFFTGRDPLGAQITFWGFRSTIVGVVGNEKFQGLSAAAPIAVYMPFLQAPSNAGTLLVRGSGDPLQLAASVRSVFRQQDSRLAIFGLETLETAIDRSLSQRRFAMLLVSAFAAVAMLLAGIGVYGVFNYDVTLRKRELGIRLALGAGRQRVVGLIVGRALTLVVVAMVIGVAAAFGLTTLVSSLLFGIGARDPLTIGGVALLLALIGLMASALPAWRASRVEPTRVLRAAD